MRHFVVGSNIVCTLLDPSVLTITVNLRQRTSTVTKAIPFILTIMTNPAVFKFNVGGTRYEISQRLVNAFPNTILAKSASKQWNEDPNAEIFIERDGSRFRYVLDCMRDGRVSLPVGVSKDAVLGDLTYYGFENVNVNSIVDTAVQAFVFGKSSILVRKLRDSWKDDVAGHELSIKILRDCEMILDEFTRKQSLNLEVAAGMKSGKSFLDCNDFLKSAGLCVEKEAFDGYSRYHVTLKLI